MIKLEHIGIGKYMQVMARKYGRQDDNKKT
jgi:hypothetical protein